MTVSSTTTKVSYSGNGSTTVFAYGFKIFADADLRVIERAADGTETVKSLTTHYTVSGAGTDSGGNVTFGTAPASGVTVIIKRNLSLTQGTDYVANDPFPAESHEEALDRLTFIAQQQAEQIDRSIVFPDTDTAATTIPNSVTRANKFLGFGSSGEVAVLSSTGTAPGSIDTGNLVDAAVTSPKLAANSVTSAKIVDGTIVTADLADDAVNQAKIADDAVGTAQIADDAVAQAQIADDAVGSAQIADDAVGAAQIADDAVGLAQLSATGTPSSSSFLRGDNAWAAMATSVSSFVSSSGTVTKGSAGDLICLVVGGGAGGQNGGGTSQGSGGGGGAGGCVIGVLPAVPAGQSITVTIGSGGAGSASSTSRSNGAAGGSTTVQYGSNFVRANGGSVGSAGNSSDGGNGQCFTDRDALTDSPGAGTFSVNGGSGGGGAMGTGGNSGVGNQAAGGNGTGYGAGGGGGGKGQASDFTPGGAGGNGTAGCVIFFGL